MTQASRRVRAGLFWAAWAVTGSVHAAEPVPDPWPALQRFVGEWAGTATGRAGEGTVTRRYTPVMNGRFIHEVNLTRYPPQEKNKAGEVHEHWGVFSHDKARQLIVLRQFHVEGFVNTYRQVPSPEVPASLVFESEAFENFSNAWRARERYEFIGDDEFVETFELAPPGKPYELYSRNHFKRAAR